MCQEQHNTRCKEKYGGKYLACLGANLQPHHSDVRDIIFLLFLTGFPLVKFLRFVKFLLEQEKNE